MMRLLMGLLTDDDQLWTVMLAAIGVWIRRLSDLEEWIEQKK